MRYGFPHSKHLNVFIAKDSAPPSFNPLDSDGIINAIPLEQMVGTLVRMSPSGHYEGYLAKTWQVSNDFRDWTFVLRQGLLCEDGAQINAHSFANSLNKIIRLIKQHSSMPLIDQLVGCESTRKARPIPGIQALNDHELALKFTKPIRSGLLEYLALPYLGFYCDANFDDQGEWGDSKKIVSSAAYQLDKWEGEGPLTLKLRKGWFRLASNPPELLTIHTKDMTQLEVPEKRCFVINFLQEQWESRPNFTIVNMSPTILNAVMISSKRNPWLSVANNRRYLRQEIKRMQVKMPQQFNAAQNADCLYPDPSKPKREATETFRAPIKPKDPLLIVTSERPSIAVRYMTQLITWMLDELNLPYKIQAVPPTQHDLMKSERDAYSYDLKVIAVDAGLRIENQVVKFMFCSNLGAAFGDPSGRICSLVDKYEQEYGDFIPEEKLKLYKN